jgi:hypothetical protein
MNYVKMREREEKRGVDKEKEDVNKTVHMILSLHSIVYC